MIRKRQLAYLAVAVVAASTLTGCQLGWVMLERMFPSERVPAKFKLPRRSRVLVFPDDVRNPVSYPPVKRTLAKRLNQRLMEKKLVADTVSYEKLIELQAAEPDFNRMAVASVGRKLGADVVVYVSIDEFSLKDSPVDTLWRGSFSAKVRVVDVQKGRLWPDETAGHPVKVSEPLAESTSESFGATLARMLAERLADEVAGLFHEHYVDRHRPKDAGSIFD